jgi:hypothetical protein
MSIHQCPKCELRFEWKTELDDHCWHDHPEFRHEYPATAPPPEPEEAAPAAEPVAPEHHSFVAELGAWMLPRRSAEHDHLDNLA